MLVFTPAVPALLLAAAAPTPDDALLDQQWALEVIDAPGAWALTVGSGQRIGVVDTGLVRAHPDMQGVDAGGYDFISDPNLSGDGDGRDADYEDVALLGELAHGSHVAGIIAAATDNGEGIAGLNWDAQVVSARAVSGTQGGTNIDIMEAALWLAGGEVNNVPPIDVPVDVINMSLGFEGGCDAFAQGIVDEILARGIPIIAAVGNHGDDFGRTGNTVLSPADCAGVIAVGAVDDAGAQTAYTNDDGPVDVLAPGGSRTLGVVSLGAGETYAAQQGTSMAAPHVAGVVSLMRAVNPAMSPSDLRAVVLSTSTAGRVVDAAAAVAQAEAGGPGAAGDDPGGCTSTRSHVPAPLGALLSALGLIGLTRSCTSRACNRARWS